MLQVGGELLEPILHSVEVRLIFLGSVSEVVRGFAVDFPEAGKQPGNVADCHLLRFGRLRLLGLLEVAVGVGESSGEIVDLTLLLAGIGLRRFQLGAQAQDLRAFLGARFLFLASARFRLLFGEGLLDDWLRLLLRRLRSWGRSLRRSRRCRLQPGGRTVCVCPPSRDGGQDEQDDDEDRPEGRGQHEVTDVHGFFPPPQRWIQ